MAIAMFGTRAVEIDTSATALVVPAHGGWTPLYTYAGENRGGASLEMDLAIVVSRVGLIGQFVDLFDLLIPSSFDLALFDDGAADPIYLTHHHTSSATISTILQNAKGPLRIEFRNNNSFFAVTPIITGQIFSSEEQYDLRTRFPSCPFPVYSQQLCGACYADVVAGSGTDALCIANGGSPVATRLSPQPIISCANLGGCAGGSPYLAAIWTETHGLVEYSASPFVSSRCDPVDDVDLDGCVGCKSVMPFSPKVREFHFKPVVLTGNSEYAIRRRIQAGGSVMVIFDAHMNFQMFFQTRPFGIYTSTGDTPSLGNHAVRIVGFGMDDNGTKYWIALNSWGGAWANRGSFKILRGRNLCSIEQYPVGIEPIDAVLAGSTNSAVNHPSAGDWTRQDSHDSYWRTFIDQHREGISQELGASGWTVESIETRVGNGFAVKLKFVDEKHVKVVIHMSPEGDVSYASKVRRRAVRFPEDRSNSVVLN